MGPSSSSGARARRAHAQLDRLALGGLGGGLLLYVVPLWGDGRLRWAFWLTLLSTVLHLFTSRRSRGRDA